MKGDEQNQPNPLISTHINTDTWIILLPLINHDSSQNKIARIKRLMKNNIKEELKKRSLYYDEKENQPEVNYFRSCWALKENQEYGKKGGRKYIPEEVMELLKGFFHTGDTYKSERYLAKEMLVALQKKVEIGELEESDIPKLKTIENWIS
ncbi:3546_t:CDS:2 [Funneliformis caledonium]|uniref:3546_t:CDS:1 n=1 Tax=Funneliformis caledonium TaxID=1117310 RepID=A0A9N8VA15_9GLOM|nr:3546_t:CDS:2 [Funneliformis caledonium]